MLEFFNALTKDHTINMLGLGVVGVGFCLGLGFSLAWGAGVKVYDEAVYQYRDWQHRRHVAIWEAGPEAKVLHRLSGMQDAKRWSQAYADYQSELIEQENNEGASK